MTPTERLKAALDALPTTGPDDVAKFFTDRGIKGYLEDPGWCPTAYYLRCCGFTSPCVGENGVFTEDASFTALPYSVRQFVESFDGGEYPDLVGA